MLSHFLSKFENLRHLSLDTNLISCPGAVALSEVLGKLSRLKNLRLTALHTYTLALRSPGLTRHLRAQFVQQLDRKPGANCRLSLFLFLFSLFSLFSFLFSLRVFLSSSRRHHRTEGS